MRSCHWFALALLAALPATALAQAQPLSPQVEAQIRALGKEKAARTRVERRISSRLLYEDRMRRGLPIARGVARLRTGVTVADDGTTPVDIKAEVGAALLDGIRAAGGTVVDARPRHGAVRARIPLSAIREVAAIPGVRGVHPAGRAFTRKVDTSEGDTAHRADQLRSSLGVDGTGLTIGVLSDGVDSLASLQSTGDLPAEVAILTLEGQSQAGSGDEGTAMLEIVHDLAPGAQLVFATAFTSQTSFADNIEALQTEAAADIIVDDVGYFAESVFQDDDVAQAVNTVTAAGVLYFSSAGNSGNLDDGTAGVWEGDFNFTGATVGGDPAHDYGGGETGNEITDASPSAYSLHWSDPNDGSVNDYDLLLVNKPGTVLFAASTDVQDGDDDPFEIFGAAQNDKGRRLIVVRKSGADRYIHLNANRGELTFATAGQIGGHPGARDAFAVAAVDAGSGTPFDGTESVQTYSSDGPRRVFYEHDGTAITPGNLLATGGELRNKPDLTAADCVSTATPGFSTFCGTSAAAPHAGAIAALLLQLDPTATAQDIRDALTDTALDIEAAGYDRDSGDGVVEALAAGQAIGQCQNDADCDDAVFCNGAETCAAGACVAGGGDPCTGGPEPLCDETGDVCVDCLADGDCDDGAFCTGVETCTAGSCGSAGNPCTGGPDPLCDEVGDVCVDCLSSAECVEGELCVEGFCQEVVPVPAASEPLRAVLVLALIAVSLAANSIARQRRPRG